MKVTGIENNLGNCTAATEGSRSGTVKTGLGRRGRRFDVSGLDVVDVVDVSGDETGGV